jgi:hypothetical protein
MRAGEAIRSFSVATSGTSWPSWSMSTGPCNSRRESRATNDHP